VLVNVLAQTPHPPRGCGVRDRITTIMSRALVAILTEGSLVFRDHRVAHRRHGKRACPAGDQASAPSASTIRRSWAEMHSDLQDRHPQLNRMTAAVLATRGGPNTRTTYPANELPRCASADSP
jgi:hypothetical protein